MPKILTIGSETFDFPVENENGNYGESVTSWAEAVSQALGTVQQPNDIPVSTASILNNVTTATAILGFSFDTSQVIAIEAQYIVRRSTSSSNSVESGRIEGNYNGTSWSITVESVGTAGITFDISPSGQVTYTSTNVSGASYTGSILFKAKVFNQ